MKHLLFSLLFVSFGMFAQETHHLNWFMGISMEDASIEISEGDTVIWTFTDGPPHSITSDSGSTETFDSGILDPGSTYSHEFTQVGSNPYFCSVHPSMQGIITVSALGVEERNLREFTMLPNPGLTEFSIELPRRIDNLKIEVYDLLGNLVYDENMETSVSTVNVSTWASGIYLVKVSNGKISNTKRFIKG